MNKTVLTSFTILCLLSTVFLMGLALNIQTVKASGTIYITADGSVDPPTAPITSVDNVTYYFTDNNYDEIVVQRNNIVIDGNGYILQGSGVGCGFNLTDISNVTIQNINIKDFHEGIFLKSSDYNRVSGNNITDNDYGVYLSWSSDNNICGNNITDNDSRGIELYSDSHHNTVSRNCITNSSWAILLNDSSNNTFSGNIVINNEYGVKIPNIGGYNNIFYHNDFINNTQQVSPGLAEPPNVSWDKGYPSGGNYWSDYNGTDSYSGPYQNETGHDGIGDVPYTIYGPNQDNYPLMYQGGFIPTDINQTLTNYTCPVGSALNFTFTLNSTMHIWITLDTLPGWANAALYLKWDGTPPTSKDYDAKVESGYGGRADYVKKGLPPDTYYFMVYMNDTWDTTLFDVTLLGYYPFPELKSSLIDAPANRVYFLYADPAYMTRPESAYDVASGSIIYGLCTNTQHQGFNTTKNWLLNTGAINTTTIHDATIAMFGGTFPHVSVRYYVENGFTPIQEGWNSTHIWFENKTGTKFALSWTTVAEGHEDYFVIEVFTEGSNTFLFVYGIDWRGTWAGGIYFKEVISENLSSYKQQYYIFHWVDDSGQDGVPQSSEIVMASCG